MVEMRLAAVRVELPSNTPVLLLQEVEGPGRTLPIFIGSPEATAVAYALQGTEPPRPFTHDLMLHALRAAGSDIEKVVITELRESTYYAELHLAGDPADEAQRVVSARPSDAVNLAVRAGCPIFCSDELIEAEGVVLATDEVDAEDGEGTDEDELVDEFKDFLNQIRPQDFEQ